MKNIIFLLFLTISTNLFGENDLPISIPRPPIQKIELENSPQLTKVDSCTCDKKLNDIKKKDNKSVKEIPNITFLILYILLALFIVVIFVFFYVNRRKETNLPTIVPTFLSLLIVTALLVLYSNEWFSGTGTLTPYIEALILITSTILTFLAFYVQFRFNERQKKDIDQERIENKIFHFMDTLNSISDNINITNVGKNKKAFHFIYYEVKALYYIFYQYFQFFKNEINKEEIDKITDSQNLLSISISFVLSGVTGHSNDQIKTKIKSIFQLETNNNTIISIIEEKFKGMENIVISLQKIKSKDKNLLSKDQNLLLYVDYVQNPNKYATPWFWGHRSDLVVYIKYLAMIISYIDTLKYVSNQTKEHYYDIIYSQMSEHEIGLVYALCNSQSEFKNLIGLISSQSQSENAKEDHLYQTIKIQTSKWIDKTNDMYNYQKPQWIPIPTFEAKTKELIFSYSQRNN